jgi:xanthine/CO dehydrogenase XdhC/CoxF family maturation factor
LSDNELMTDLVSILALWRELESAGLDYVLATIVAVKGSSYRKPGALMLLTADGRRMGTVSGGCLESQVASRAWWLTADGPVVKSYSTAEDDGDRPYGSGCGGVVTLLLERKESAGPMLAALARAFESRVPLAAATVLEGPHLGRRSFAGLEPEAPQPLQSVAQHSSVQHASLDRALRELAAESVALGKPIDRQLVLGKTSIKAWADYRPARPLVAIYGAGDDAQPLLRMAKELGWFVLVADGRSHLATRERFPMADELRLLPIKDLPDLSSDRPSPAFRDLRRADAAIVMTHSFEQDSKTLACLLALDAPPAYIGVLGPQRRTRELLLEAAHLLGLLPAAGAAQAECWLAQLHAPTGLDLGADSPETIALSVLAEIQTFRTAATALPLRRVRAAAAITMHG